MTQLNKYDHLFLKCRLIYKYMTKICKSLNTNDKNSHSSIAIKLLINLYKHNVNLLIYL